VGKKSRGMPKKGQAILVGRRHELLVMRAGGGCRKKSQTTFSEEETLQTQALGQKGPGETKERDKYLCGESWVRTERPQQPSGKGNSPNVGVQQKQIEPTSGGKKANWESKERE